MIRRNRTYHMMLGLLFLLDLGYVIFYHVTGQPDLIRKTFRYSTHFFIYTFAAIPLLYLLGAALVFLLARRLPDGARKGLMLAGGVLVVLYAAIVILNYALPGILPAGLVSLMLLLISHPWIFILPGILLALELDEK